jgi:hypothetical protein
MDNAFHQPTDGGRMNTDPHDTEDSAGFADQPAGAMFWLTIIAGIGVICTCIWFDILA